MKKTLQIGVIICFAIGILSAIIYWVYTGKELDKDIAIFNSSEVKGKIESITNDKDIVTLKLNYPEKDYTFCPIIGNNVDSDFINVVLPLDSIYKKAFSDTINIYRGNKLYQFPYRR